MLGDLDFTVGVARGFPAMSVSLPLQSVRAGAVPVRASNSAGGALQRRTGQRRIWQLVVVCLLAFFTALAAAQDKAPEINLDQARKDLDAIQKQLKDQPDDTALVDMRESLVEMQGQAASKADALTPQLTSVNARLGELGEVAEGVKEAPDVAAQRSDLNKQRTALDSQIKLARLLAVESGQAIETISSLRRSQFSAALGERRPSVLTPSFWSEFQGDWPRDRDRLKSLWDEALAAAIATPFWVWAGVLLLIGAIFGVRIWASKRLTGITAARVPSGRLRRSFYAVAVVLLGVAAPGLIAELFYLGMSWGVVLTGDLATFATGFVGVMFFGGYVAGLGRALLSPNRPSWRLPSIPDLIALRMRWLPIALGIAVVVVWSLDRFITLLNFRLTTTIALNSAVAFGLAIVLGYALRRGERLRRRVIRDAQAKQASAAEAQEDEAAAQVEPPPPRPLWLGVLAGVLWCVIVGAVASVLVGYVAFGNFLLKQMVWLIIILASTYLLSVLIEDFFSTLRSATQVDASGKNQPYEPRARDQAAVLLSGVGRVLIALFALLLVLAPFGAGPMELFQRMGQLQSGLAIGEVLIKPGTVMQALIVLVVGLIAVKMLKSWLRDRYLPTTTLDPGMQLSAAALFGYAGFVIAVALAMSAVGIGLERVAWVASALSVGIGFGLQAVVQNFVSGIILLAERPVKVGDWVSLSAGVEGDIRRINVRATEIQMSDRSTLIVPNSEFITKHVRNVTHANPQGVVTVKMPLPLGTDAQRVREIMLSVFQDNPDVLETPAPNVFLDGIDGTHLMFNASGSVSSPRQSYTVRSALLFEILNRLSAAKIEMSQQPTMLLGSLENRRDGKQDGDSLVPPISAAMPPADAPTALASVTAPTPPLPGPPKG
ncbi:DUF3772 domain-containing protein [Alcaligenaceae bacterium B3P038]|nr:DUF3772 domain-containing protein [Alcaligenaceae bacterium B3P038]